MSKLFRVAVLIGGSGSNLQALIDNAKEYYQVAGVISHNPNAYGIERAKSAGIPFKVVSHQDFPTREGFELALYNATQSFEPDCVALAGFMRILSPYFVQQYRTKLINIHPSLLPKYRGLHTHQQVLEAGDKLHGASIHFVTEELDGGPLIAQSSLEILSSDSPESLQKRVLSIEHWLYPQVVSLLAQKRLKFDGKIVTLDGEPVSVHGLSLISPTAQGTVS